MRKIHENILKKLTSVNDTTIARRKKVQKKDPQLKEGDKVYLLTKNLKTRRPAKKLNYIKVGPFLIKQVKGPITYRLELLKDAKIYPVFYILLLKLVYLDILLQEIFYFKT